MKRLIFGLCLAIILSSPVSSSPVSEIKTCLAEKSAKNEVRKVLKNQDKYAQNYNINALSKLYSKDFKSFDGFNKTDYVKMIVETWQTYPDITYSTEIKNIDISGDTATVNVHETSVATSTQEAEGVRITGELNSYSNGSYYLKKINGKWKFTGEKIANEKSFLKYGDTRFVDMDLISPETVKQGEYYCSTLKVDLPENSMAIASISREDIVYPMQKPEEIFRKLPEDNILERMFYANKNGRNEYNIASVGMTKSEVDGTDLKVYMSGIAFILTRVNVEEENAQKD